MGHLQDYLKDLTEFHETFGHPVVRSFADCSFDKLPLRKTLIAEECAEYTNAKTRVEIIDALGDLLYVVVGTILTTGVLPHEYQERATVICTKTKLPLISPVNELLKVLGKLQPCYKGLWETTTVLYWKIHDAAIVYGVDLYNAFKLIHKSNMTKIWPMHLVMDSPEFNPDLMEASFVASERIPAGCVVTRKSDGKVLKPSTYQPVDLTKL